MPLAVTGHGLRISLSEVSRELPGHVRISIDPTRKQPTRVGEDARVRLGDVTVEYDPATGMLALRHDQGRTWSGSFAPLERYGRAGVAGVEIVWNATPKEAIYGLGERFDSFNLAGRKVEMWLVDAPGQGGEGSETYYVTPVAYSSAGYSLVADDNPEGEFDLNSAGDGFHRYRRAGERVSFVIGFGPDIPRLIADRTRQIGGLEPVPDWAFQPWISKNSYETQAEAEDAMEGMRERDLPFGVIVLEAWKGPSETGEFNRFSQERWPDPEGFLERCVQDGVRVILWQVPILHPSSPWFAEAAKRSLLVRDPAGDVSLREEWLAGFGNIDFYKPEAIAFWKDMLRPVVRMGIAGFKADDGEAIKPTDLLGHDDIPGWQAHNEWAALYNIATYELFKEEGIDGMLWARSGSLGIEKAPALWAGDQGAEWSQMQRLVTAGLSSSISGMPFWGHDIGGYYGTATPELYIRWLQFGALSPFMQFHGIEPREPWHFGEHAVEAYRQLAHLRLNLLPSLLDLADEAARTGAPLMRPMFFAGLDDPSPGLATQYLLGDDMLVAPVMQPGATKRFVDFPPGRWLHASQPLVYTGPGRFSVPLPLDQPPLFLRDGATLRVQLREDALLGEWDAQAPQRHWHVTPGTLWRKASSLTDLRVPAVGNITGHPVTLSFKTDTELESFQVHWSLAGEKGLRREASVQRTGQVLTADLTPDDLNEVIGRRQAYTIHQQGRLLISGEIDWRELVTIEVRDPYGDVVTASPATVEANVTNRTPHPVTIELGLNGAPEIKIPNPNRLLRLEPEEGIELSWTVDVAEKGQVVGDSRVEITAAIDGVQAARAEAALVRAPKWVVAGPFPATSKESAFAAPYPPEWVSSPDARFTALDQSVRWEAFDTEVLARDNAIDFNQLFGEQHNAAAYVMTMLESNTDQPAEVRVGSDDTLTLWVNGELQHAGIYDRPALPDQNIIPIQLKRGSNHILAKVAQGQGGWGFVARFTGPDGGVLTGVVDSLHEQSWYAADRPASRATAISSPRLSWSVLGPFPINSIQDVQGVPEIEAHIRREGKLPTSHQSRRLRPARSGDEVGYIDLTGLNPNRDQLAYASTSLEVDSDQTIEIRAGSDDGLVLWVNGREILQAERPRALTPAEDRIRLELPAGAHHIVARISQGGGDWGFLIEAWAVDELPLIPLGSHSE